jgi:hypothetical protein
MPVASVESQMRTLTTAVTWSLMTRQDDLARNSARLNNLSLIIHANSLPLTTPLTVLSVLTTLSDIISEGGTEL